MLIYVNGKPSGRLERTDGKLGAVEGHPLEFGHYVAAKSQRLTGALEEVRLFRRALADEEISRLTDEERRRVGVD